MYFQDIVELAKKSDDVLIIGHMNPDGDCVGATLAFAMLLEKKNVKAKVLLKDVPNTYDFLPLDKWVTEKEPNKIDLLISLDCGDVSRFGDYEDCIEKANTIINIDHHTSNNNFGQYNIVNGTASSTCEVIYSILDDLSLIDESIAAALYTGIVYDTGVFKHSNTKESTLTIAGKLISYGFDFTEIINKMFSYKSLIGLKVQSRAMSNLKVYSNDQIAITYLTRDEIYELRATKKETEGIVQILNEIENIECAVFIFETEQDEHKVSLRSKGIVNVCEIARNFGGGGHKKASGCSVEGHLTDVIERIVSVVNEQLVMS